MRTALMVAVLAAGACAAAGSRVADYRPYFALCAGQRVAIRRFCLDDSLKLLIVDPHTLATAIVSADSSAGEPLAWDSVGKAMARMPYFRALAEAGQRDTMLQDAGITRARRRLNGIDLTVDLCPSRRPLDRWFFRALLQALGKEERPVPVAVSITGAWMREHPADLAWLVERVHAGELAITWVNHTYHHHTSKGLPIRTDFILRKGIDLDSEVLKTEVALIENGLTPSVFFRFPGLVSDSSAFRRVLAFGLIPVGTDAWLAKGQWPKEGSIVLVHANGNEPYGIRLFLDLLSKNRDRIRNGSWMLYDLRESETPDPDTVGQTPASRPDG